jgi:hypothetical protein
MSGWPAPDGPQATAGAAQRSMIWHV